MKSQKEKKLQKPLLLALHGFTGESYDFAPLYERLVIDVEWRFVDLPGHLRNSESLLSESDEWELFVSRIEEIVCEGIEQQRALHVLAYSMGARLFLKALLQEGWSLSKLVLVGATGGLQSIEEREERLAHDQTLADNLLNNGIDSFIDDWMNQPIIRSQYELTPESRIKGKKQLNAQSLAESLVRYSNGNLPQVWDQLGQLSVETLLVAGEKDEKFQALHERMAQLFKCGKCIVIEGAGHAPHLESPDCFSNVMIRFLNE